MGILDRRILISSKSSITPYPTTSGRLCNHIRQDRWNTLLSVGEAKLKRDLWENVRALMIRDWGKENVTRLGREAKIGGSASRIKAQKTAVGLDVLAKVGKLFKVAPHHLVLPPDERAILENEKILHIARIYSQTDDEGRRTIHAGAQIAETRIDGGVAGMGKPSKAHDR